MNEYQRQQKGLTACPIAGPNRDGSAVPRPPGALARLASLSEILDALGQEAAALEERVGPILRCPDPVGAISDPETGPTQSDVDGQLDRLIVRALRIREDLKSIHLRVTL